MLNCQKDKFDLPDDISYINVAYMSPLLKSVEKAGIEGLKKKTHPWTIVRSDFFDPVTQVKEQFSKVINCKEPERIALVPSVSYGLGNAVKNIPAQKGQQIILVDEGFPSNYYPWEKLAEKSGCQIKIISPPKDQFPLGKIWNEKILEAIDENTIAISLGNVHWADGTLFDLKRIREKTNQFGAYLIIDGTQSVGAFPFDIQEVQPDALICASYKWLLGAYSFGLSYYGEKFDGGEPIEESWFNRLNSHQFENLVNYQKVYKEKANRYMMGEQSNFIAIPMQQLALDQILNWGVENIQSYCKNLIDPYVEKLKNLGCKIEDENYRTNHLLGVRPSDEMDLEKLKILFSEKNIFVSHRGNSIRIAPHVYNTNEDFEKLVGCFEKSISNKTVF